MTLVAHKYTPSEISAPELEATFAARGHTLDYLIKTIRDQTHSGTLSSLVITGPRGAGKSTLIQMVALRLRGNPDLSKAWIPILFPEEQFGIASLRDFLEQILVFLAKGGLAKAEEWLEKVRNEPNEEQSQQLVETGLKEITRQEGKRLVVFVENLNLLLEQSLDDKMKGTLRRLLMIDPFMMIIGSSVHTFESLKNYDEAFFNYFDQVPLGRLSEEDVFDLLMLRARFDGNQQFMKEFPKQRPKVRAIVHLSGGNPRLILMLYELLSHQQITSIVQYLRRLVDELTPLLKDELENLPVQQRKIIHALMERGGTAKPAELATATRLPLNAVTSQLKRLKEAQVAEVLGGGKGKTANYTVPDKLFAIWYQMRYLAQNRRRIELFVEVLRIWFAEEDRVKTLQLLEERSRSGAPSLLRECANTSEYFAASLRETPHEQLARDLSIQQWVRTDLREAASAYAELSGSAMDENSRAIGLADWLCDHDDAERARATLDEVLQNKSLTIEQRAKALIRRGIIKGRQGDAASALAEFAEVIELEGVPKGLIARALVNRGVAKGRQGDLAGALADYTVVTEMEDVPKDLIARALVNRGWTKGQQEDVPGELADYAAVIEMEGAPRDQVATALVNRGWTKTQQRDAADALADYAAVIEMEGAPKDLIARALFNRGVTKGQRGDVAGKLADYSAVIEMEGVPKDLIARALFNRGVTKGQQGDVAGELADYAAVIEMDGAPKDQVAFALFSRAIVFEQRRDFSNAWSDAMAALDLGVAADNLLPDVAKLGFTVMWNADQKERVKAILAKFSKAVANLPKESGREMTLRLLHTLASPESKSRWSFAYQTLTETQNPEIVEALEFLRPVSAILEGGDPVLLDALPPEQREFVQTVLARFETKA